MSLRVERIEKALVLGGKHLSAWEQGFLESLKSQAEKGRNLSPKQLEILERVEKQKCSPEAHVAAEAWAKSYKAEKRSTAITVARYYMKQNQYFLGLASKILSDPDFVPGEKAYRKLCENKYAQRVLAELEKAPKFAVGDVVCLRSGNFSSEQRIAMRRLCRVAGASAPLLILAVNTEMVASAVKGAKQYTVLPYGMSDTFIFEERVLKKHRKSKKTVKKTTSCDEEILF